MNLSIYVISINVPKYLYSRYLYKNAEVLAKQTSSNQEYLFYWKYFDKVDNVLMLVIFLSLQQILDIIKL
jgi:hypothetical protein